MNIKFLEIEEILFMHDKLVERFGGAYGLRDRALLDSAINAPQATFGGTYLYQDLYEMSAAYAFGIINNHPFVDGNKRTGMTVSVLFLWSHNIKIKLTQDQLFDLAIAMATSKLKIIEVADILRKTKTIKPN